MKTSCRVSEQLHRGFCYELTPQWSQPSWDLKCLLHREQTHENFPPALSLACLCFCLSSFFSYLMIVLKGYIKLLQAFMYNGGQLQPCWVGDSQETAHWELRVCPWWHFTSNIRLWCHLGWCTKAKQNTCLSFVKSCFMERVVLLGLVQIKFSWS